MEAIQHLLHHRHFSCFFRRLSLIFRVNDWLEIPRNLPQSSIFIKNFSHPSPPLLL
jgi:hypothetical protein